MTLSKGACRGWIQMAFPNYEGVLGLQEKRRAVDGDCTQSVPYARKVYDEKTAYTKMKRPRDEDEGMYGQISYR